MWAPEGWGCTVRLPGKEGCEARENVTSKSALCELLGCSDPLFLICPWPGHGGEEAMKPTTMAFLSAQPSTLV